MLWGKFDNKRSTLNMYDNPHFEPGSGLADTDVVVALLDRAIAEGATALERKRDLLRQKTVNAEQN